LTGLAVLGVTGVALVVYVVASSHAAVPRPDQMLECAGDQQIAAIEVVHAAVVTAEKLTPEQIVERYLISTAAARSAVHSGNLTSANSAMRRVYSSDSRVEIAVQTSTGRTAVVVTMVNDANGGWRIESIHECS
jgi:hypothetical protein